MQVNGVSRVGLSIVDSGPGIAPDEQDAIFEAYYRSEAAALAPGVGLGLAISKALIERMGGALTVESVVGHGAVFTISWPVE
jgi:signal transduction histidine kinase